MISVILNEKIKKYQDELLGNANRMSEIEKNRLDAKTEGLIELSKLYEQSLEISSCPHDGGEGVLKTMHNDERVTVYYVACRKCAACGGWGRSPAEAIELWNMRENSKDN